MRQGQCAYPASLPAARVAAASRRVRAYFSPGPFAAPASPQCPTPRASARPGPICPVACRAFLRDSCVGPDPGPRAAAPAAAQLQCSTTYRYVTVTPPPAHARAARRERKRAKPATLHCARLTVSSTAAFPWDAPPPSRSQRLHHILRRQAGRDPAVGSQRTCTYWPGDTRFSQAWLHPSRRGPDPCQAARCASIGFNLREVR